MNYLVLSVVVAAVIGGAFGQFTFNCNQEWSKHGVDHCPRKGRLILRDDPDENMKCCIHESEELIPTTGVRIKVYGCCYGMPDYVYGIMGGIGVVIIISIVLCCCCCGKRRQQPGFVIFQNPPVVQPATQVGVVDDTRPV